MYSEGLPEGDDMAIIRKNDIRKMTPKEAEAKIDELERSLLVLEGEGKNEKIKPVKKAIAKLKTLLTLQKKAEEKQSKTDVAK